MVYRLCLLGLTDRELAKAFDVEYNTIDYWKRSHPEFLEAMFRGKVDADSKAAESLLRAAIGYDYPEEVAHVVNGEIVVTTIMKHCKANPWAAHKWLTLRRRGDWSETSRVEVTHTNINANMNFDDLSAEELKFAIAIGMKNRQNQITEDAGNND